VNSHCELFGKAHTVQTNLLSVTVGGMSAVISSLSILTVTSQAPANEKSLQLVNYNVRKPNVLALFKLQPAACFTRQVR